MACPSITFVVGSTPTPAQRGGVANANVTNGTLGITGGVVLRCGTTDYGVTELLWTPAAVSFRVPQNLPACAQGYQAIFSFAGQVCPAPIAIAGAIVPEPVVILSPQPILATSEQRLDLIGLNFGSKPVARLPQLDPFYVQQNTYRNPTNTGFGTDMATIRGLQTAADYRRNAVLMDMQLVAVNRDDPNAERASAPALVKLSMPTPQAGRVTALGRELYFGHIVSRPDLPRVGDTEWLGGPAPHGEVRLYASDPTGTLNSLRPLVAGVIAAGATFIDPTTEPGVSLRRLRESGTLLPVSYWHEEGVLAQLPAENTTGSVIIWRDDLPSEPQPIVRTPTFDCAKLTEFVAGAWRLAVNGREFLLDINQSNVINIAAADAPLFEVRRVSGVSNPLTLLLDAAGSASSIRFGFLPSAVGFPTDPQDFRPQIGALSFGTLQESLVLKTLLHPDLVSRKTAKADLGFKDWDITLIADVTVPGCGNVRLNLVRIRLHQAPLVVPTIAVFFTHINFTGDPLIVVDSDNSVLPANTFADAAVNSGSLGRLVATVAVTLDALALALKTLSVFSNVSGPTRRLPPFEHAQVLNDVAAALRASGLRPAVDARGATINLDNVIRKPGGWFGIWEEDFKGVLSSALMVGLPNWVGIRGVKSAGILDNELSALFRVPAGTVIASTTDFRGVFYQDDRGWQYMKWSTNTSKAVEDLHGSVIIAGGPIYFNDLWDKLEFRRH